MQRNRLKIKVTLGIKKKLELFTCSFHSIQIVLFRFCQTTILDYFLESQQQNVTTQQFTYWQQCVRLYIIYPYLIFCTTTNSNILIVIHTIEQYIFKFQNSQLYCDATSIKVLTVYLTKIIYFFKIAKMQ